jgi:hypothetical protein
MTALESFHGGRLGLLEPPLTLYETGELTPEESRYRQPTLRREHPGVTQGLLVEGEGNVPSG